MKIYSMKIISGIVINEENNNIRIAPYMQTLANKLLNVPFIIEELELLKG